MLSFASAAPALAIEAYIFRGAGDFSFIGKGLTFSNGMDRIGEQLEASGIRSSVYRWEAGEIAYREIMSRKPDAVALMGHSMGALTSLALAERLKGSGVRVAYLGVIDIPGPVGVLASNVEWAENFYHAYPVFGMLTKGSGHKGFVSNEYVHGQIHITMDKSQRVHLAMISAIWQADARTGRAFARAYAPEQPAKANLERIEQAFGSPAPQPTDPVVTASTAAPAKARPAGILPPVN